MGQNQINIWILKNYIGRTNKEDRKEDDNNSGIEIEMQRYTSSQNAIKRCNDNPKK